MDLSIPLNSGLVSLTYFSYELNSNDFYLNLSYSYSYLNSNK